MQLSQIHKESLDFSKGQKILMSSWRSEILRIQRAVKMFCA